VNRKLTEVLKEEEQDKKLSSDIKRKREETQSNKIFVGVCEFTF